MPPTTNKQTVGQLLGGMVVLFSQAGITTARLDAQVLLGDTLGKDKSWLLVHADATVSPQAQKTLEQKAKLRAQRHPLAYIRGRQEFYGRDFTVTPTVLIPRPETELLVDTLKTLCKNKALTMVDVGTGSGAIAVTAALELPQSTVAACDISPAALAIAQKNAAILNAKVTFFESNLLASTAKHYDIIVANLPYVDSAWQTSPETQLEPKIALYASDGGMALIKQLIRQAPHHLNTGGLLLLEADPRQHKQLVQYAVGVGLKLLSSHDFVLTLQR